MLTVHDIIDKIIKNNLKINKQIDKNSIVSSFSVYGYYGKNEEQRTYSFCLSFKYNIGNYQQPRYRNVKVRFETGTIFRGYLSINYILKNFKKENISNIENFLEKICRTEKKQLYSLLSIESH